MRISVIVTYLTHDPMIKVQVLCPHTGTLGGCLWTEGYGDDRYFLSENIYSWKCKSLSGSNDY